MAAARLGRAVAAKAAMALGRPAGEMRQRRGPGLDHAAGELADQGWPSCTRANPGGHNYPAPDLIKGPVQAVNGTIVECNTAYPGQRFNTEQHMAALRDHGFRGLVPGRANAQAYDVEPRARLRTLSQTLTGIPAATR